MKGGNSMLHSVLWSSTISRQITSGFFCTCVVDSVLGYAMETQILSLTLLSRIQAVEMDYWRRCMKITWLDKWWDQAEEWSKSGKNRKVSVLGLDGKKLWHRKTTQYKNRQCKCAVHLGKVPRTRYTKGRGGSGKPCWLKCDLSYFIKSTYKACCITMKWISHVLQCSYWGLATSQFRLAGATNVYYKYAPILPH